MFGVPQQAPGGGSAAGGHRGPGDPAAGPPAPAAAGNPFAPSPAPTPPRPTSSRASTPVRPTISRPSTPVGRAPTPPTAAEVLGELRDVMNAMDGTEGDMWTESDEAKRDAWSEGDALSADGPDEVIARERAEANRWPDGGEAAHPVRRPPAPDVLFPPGLPPDPGSAHPGASRPDSNVDDTASVRSFATAGSTDGGRSSPQPADERMPRPSAPASVGDASGPSWHNSAGQTTHGINAPGTQWPPRTATYPDLQGPPPHPLLQAQMGFVGPGGPVPQLLLQQPDQHAYMLQPFPQFFPMDTPRGGSGDLAQGAQGGGVPGGGPGAPAYGAPDPGLPGPVPPAGRPEDVRVHGAVPGGGPGPRPPGAIAGVTHRTSKCSCQKFAKKPGILDCQRRSSNPDVRCIAPSQ